MCCCLPFIPSRERRCVCVCSCHSTMCEEKQSFRPQMSGRLINHFPITYIFCSLPSFFVLCYFCVLLFPSTLISNTPGREGKRFSRLMESQSENRNLSMLYLNARKRARNAHYNMIPIGFSVMSFLFAKARGRGSLACFNIASWFCYNI